MKKLENLNLTGLTNVESGQLIKRNLTDLSNVEINLDTDPKIKNYLTKMQDDSDEYDKALLQVRKNEETDVLAQLDNERDTAIAIYNRQLNVYEYSDDPAEVEAYKSLKIVTNTFKNIATLNYEAQTNAMTNMVQTLHEPQYADHITTLNLGRYITRMNTGNTAFNTRFTNRSTDTAWTEVYNAKEIRKSMLKNYSNYVNYVLLLANSEDTMYYNRILLIINNIRSYYADTLARRQPNKKAPAAGPATA